MSTPLEALPLAQGLLTAVRTQAGAQFAVYFGGAPHDVSGKYAVFYPDTGVKSPFLRTLNNDGPDELRHQWTSVGVGPEQALWVADKVSIALLTTVPAVDGRRVWRTVEEDAQPLRRDDESTGLFYVTAQYLTRSDPA